MGLFDKIKDVLTSSDSERSATPEATPQTAAQGREIEEAAVAGGEGPDQHDAPSTPSAEAQGSAGAPGSAQDTATGGDEADGAEPGEGYRTVTVVPGDTFSGIASRFGVDPQAMASLNGVDNPELIYPGQVFKVPHA